MIDSSMQPHLPNSTAHEQATSQKPRVCLITESYYPIVGGGETQSRITAEDLVARGFEVMIVTRQSHSELKTYEEIGAIRVHRVPPQGKGHLKRWTMIKNVLPLLIKKRHEFDVVLVCGYRALGIPAVLVSQIYRKTCILKADNNGEMSGAFFAGGLKKWNLELSSWPVRLSLWLRNGLFKRADAFVSLSSEISHELNQAGIPPHQVWTIPNSVDVDKFHPVSDLVRANLRSKLGLPEDKKIVVYTGRLLTTKGLPPLLAVWKDIQPAHPNVKLLIVGGGSKDIHDCEDYLHSFVKNNQLSDSVHFTGDVNNVDEYLKAADVFVFPTWNEAFGISLIEAMACGLPVIATPTGGPKDIVTDEENGLFAEFGNFEQLKQAIETLVASAPKANALGAAALETVQERYTRTAVAQQYVNLLTQKY